MNVSTFHRRRQWRDRRAQTTLAELSKADMMIRVHCLLAAFSTALLVLVAAVRTADRRRTLRELLMSAIIEWTVVAVFGVFLGYCAARGMA